MSAFFSLGGSSSSAAAATAANDIPPPPPPSDQPFFNWPYAKNNEHDHTQSHPHPYKATPSFELWHHHQHQQEVYHQHRQDLYSSATALGVGPTAAQSGEMVGRAGVGSTSGGVSCQDCGNQAKKDCTHMRCRTCCKSRGFECQTHVKSTWVPAARRRERQHHHSANLLHHHQRRDDDDDDDDDHPNQQILQISGGGGASKRQRDSTATALATTHHRFPSHTSSGTMEVGNFPAEVSSNAVFRCVRVSSFDSGDDQYAYQTSVNIGGHLFKGILLDHGPENAANYSTSTIGGGGGGDTSSGGAQPQPLDLIATSAPTAPFDPTAMYQSAVVQPINAYTIAGTQFFLPPRS